jgi:hypothetical protein
MVETKMIAVMLFVALTNAAKLPEISFAELKLAISNPSSFGKLKDAGGKFSAFVVKDIETSGYSDAVTDIIGEAPGCVGKDFRFPRVTLADGSTRRTIATSDGKYPDCLKPSATIVAQGFESVEKLVSTMVEVVAAKSLTYIEGNTKTRLADAPHKDHIHVYERKEDHGAKMLHDHQNMMNDHKQDARDYLVPYHIDNGMFLLITPFPNHGMQMELSDGSKVSTDEIDHSSVLVLFGLGLNGWMFQVDEEAAAKFHPVPHAVPALRMIHHRSVFARMIVAPAAAKPEIKKGLFQEKLLTFDEVFMKRSMNQSRYDSQVCSVDLFVKPGNDSWRDAMDAMCSEGEAYCWMGCYPLPKSCPSPDLAMCFSNKSNVTCSTEPNGKPMDPTCKWECAPQVEGVYKTSSYCNGKMDMLMLGFDVSGKRENPCIVLFIEAWTLDSQIKFWTACFGVMALGFGIEALIALRRTISRRRNQRLNLRGAGTHRCVVVACFALNLIIGYLAMLVVMTYSIELFSSVIIGLIIGHAFFNWNTAVGESVDPCCATSQNDVCLSKRGCDDACTNLIKDDNDEGQDTSLTVATNIMGSPSNTSNNTTCCNGSPMAESRTENSLVNMGDAAV